ncbi:hypothetical protein Pdw03_7802 [Penicillium digitatum]|nr:hypothetical protein Pdw03_7802 [Penicillium digitatum]
MPNDNPACADCKAKKKRCIHRNLPAKVTKADVPANMPSPSDPTPPPVPTPAPTSAPVTAPGAATRGCRKVAEAKLKETSPALADSSDELSSVPSETEQKPVANKPTKSSRRAKPAAEPQNGALNLPADNLQAASTMSVHRIWARQLQDDLQELERSMEAFTEAHHDTMAAAQAIQRTVEGWIQTWAASGR